MQLDYRIIIAVILLIALFGGGYVSKIQKVAWIFENNKHPATIGTVCAVIALVALAGSLMSPVLDSGWFLTAIVATLIVGFMWRI